MPQFWENCNIKSQAILRYLYKRENGMEPDFWLVLQGIKRQPDNINAPDAKELEEIEIDKELREKPHHQKRVK